MSEDLALAEGLQLPTINRDDIDGKLGILYDDLVKTDDLDIKKP